MRLERLGRDATFRAAALVAALGAVCVASAFAAAGQDGPQEDLAQATADPDDSELVARYRAAARESERPIDAYNLGTALMRDGRWIEAREALRLASRSDRQRVREFGLYNYGASSARAAVEGEADSHESRSLLISARQAFRQILRDRPEDEDTRWNLELVERWLEERQEESGGQGEGGGEAPPQGGGSEGSSQGGAEGRNQQPVSPEEAAALLDSAGDAESETRDRMMGRTRYRDPVVEKNW